MVSMLDPRSRGSGSSLAGALRCVFGQDTLLSQCISAPRCINGYRRIYCDGLASHPGGIRNTPSRFMLQNRDNDHLSRTHL